MSEFNPNSADEPGGEWPEPAGRDGDSVGGRGRDRDIAASEREQARDRRLLRFVYATAALTGVLAVVIYAGDWFFDPPQSRGLADEKMVQILSDPPPENDRTPTTDPAGNERSEPRQAMRPPVPPAPVAPAHEGATAGPGVETRPLPQMVPGAAGSQVTPGTAGEGLESGSGREMARRSGGTAEPDSARTPADAPAAASAPADPRPIPVSPEKMTAPDVPAEEPKAPASVAAPTPETPAVAPQDRASVATATAETTAPAPKTSAPAPKEPTSVAAASPDAPATPKRSPSGRYLAQLGSVTSAAGAQRFWERVRNKHRDILGAYELIVEKRDIANRGTFYRVQVGRFSTLEDVRGLCGMLKAREQGCLPVKR